MRRIGVFGGTFDPPHVGHLVVAQDVLDALPLDVVLFVPAGTPPHKPIESLTPAPLRAEMVRAAVQADPRFEVSDVELVRDGPSYTVDTLRALRESHVGAQLFLIIGQDQFAEFDTWKEPQEVARLARLVVMAREGEAPESARSGVAVEFDTVPVTRVDVSSTAVRGREAAGERIRGLVPDPVWRIIQREKLYSHG